MPAVLMVCTGNTCRSPMAMTLLRQKVARLPGDWVVESAGTRPYVGDRATAEARAAMTRRGLSLENHRAREVSAEMLARFDLILTMTDNHYENLRLAFPAAAPRIHRLCEIVGLDKNVADPIGGTSGDYERTAVLLDDWLERGLPRLVELAALPH